VQAEHAQKILNEGSADLIALGREVLHNPNWALDAALKLGVNDPYRFTALTSGFWLSQRAASVPDFRPSTHDAH
jgi:2,4-dienoyl-CoA reductase-like NADH-dependent reductase (Old Yellow Enzyme family)